MGRKVILDDMYELIPESGYWKDLGNGPVRKGDVRLIEDTLHFAVHERTDEMNILTKEKGRWVWKPVPLS